MQLPGGDPWQSGGRVDASARTPTRPTSFYPVPAWNNYRPTGVSSPSSAHGGQPQSSVPPSNSAGCAGMPGVTNPVPMPLNGATSPMPSMPVMPPGSGQVPQVPLAQFGSPLSLGMFGNFTNVSHQMGSQMGYPNESNRYAPQSQTMNGNQHFAAAREPWSMCSAELMSWTMQCSYNSDFSFGLSGSNCRTFCKSSG